MAEPESAGSAPCYKFGDLTLDLGRHRLWRGTEPIQLSKLTFELLRVLVEQAPNVVAHEDLASKTWGSRRVVTPECLAKRVMLLRQALGDQADRPRYIERIRGQGCRLIPAVQQVEGEQAPPDAAHAAAGAAAEPEGPPQGDRGARPAGVRPSRLKAILAAAALVAAVTAWMSGEWSEKGDARGPGRALAVLPFENRSAAEEEAEFFASGIHDELITRLAAIGDLKITPRASVMEWGRASSSREAGEELDVDVVLDGSVQRAGDMVRVNVQLVDTRTNETLWGESYDDELTAGSVFAIQRQIATTIARELQAKLTPEEATRLGETPTQNMRALDLYLSGRDYERPPFAYWGMAALQYERAVAEDQQFALAYARLSLASLLAFYNVDWDRSRIETAKQAAEEAIRLQPDLGIARVAMAFYLLSIGGDVERAAEELAMAEPDVQGEPQFFIVRALLNERLGKREEAMADRAAALALSPRDPVLMLDVAQWHARVREHEEAERLVERALDIRPDFLGAEMFKAELALLRSGDAGPIRALSPEDFSDDPGRRVRLRRLRWLGALYERDYDAAVRIISAPFDEREDGGGDSAAERELPLSDLLAKAATLRVAGDLEAARELYGRGLARIEASEQPWSAWRAAFLAGTGETTKAVRLARQVLEESSSDSSFADDLRLWVLLEVLAPSHASAEAVAVLDQYLSRPGSWSLRGILGDPRLDPIRRAPRFKALVARYRRHGVAGRPTEHSKSYSAPAWVADGVNAAH